jgi:hypothetical protein
MRGNRPFLFVALGLAAVLSMGQVTLQNEGLQFPDGTIQTTAAASGSAPVEDTGQETCWDFQGVEIPCGVPLAAGQDGHLQRGVDWPTPRFSDNLDGTVADNLTGLTWLQDANCFSISPDTWVHALTSANTLADGSCGLADGSMEGDWRLPNIKELLSLVDYEQSSPSLPSGHLFVDVQSSYYFSSSTNVADPDSAWSVHMLAGLGTVSTKIQTYHVWPVRGGR